MLLKATLLLIAAILAAEHLWPTRRSASDLPGNLRAFLLGLAVNIFLLPAVALSAALDTFILFDLSAWPILPAIVAFTIAMDLGEFVFHRAQHAWPWLWRMHALHHSDPNMNVLTTVRHFWGDQLIKAVTIWPLAGMLFKPTPAVVAAYMAISLFHFFAHSNLRVGLGRWSWLINSPAYHRRHHSIEEAHWNCNFAGLFPIFDVICGTYRRPDSYPRTGLEKAPRTLMDIAIWPLRAR